MYSKHRFDPTQRAPRVAGAGLLALDVVLCEADGPGALAFAGGTCGNVLSILSFLRWTSTPIGFVGDDAAGKRVLADLATAGVRAAHLVENNEWTTPVFIQHLARDSRGRPRHTFTSTSYCPNCGHPLGGSETTENKGTTPIQQFTAAEKVDVFFMDRLSDDILSLAKSAKAQGAKVFYEPSAQSDIRYWSEIFELVDIVKYSADRFDEDELAPFLMHRARNELWEVKTLGARGLTYRRHLKSSTVAPQWLASEAIATSHVVDTCGAGDWCSAGLLHGLMAVDSEGDGLTFPHALRLGQLLAAWACAFVGARGAMYGNDPETIWAAIAAFIESRDLDLSRLPSGVEHKTLNSGGTASCVPGLCTDP